LALRRIRHLQLLKDQVLRPPLDKLTAAGVEFAEHSGVSLYFRDPDGARIELIADPLGEMYGSKVL
jgi:catechol 2,3-dioxygenase-like lactoylglutathione lyase family enzyme